jgi:hypothetical protein
MESTASRESERKRKTHFRESFRLADFPRHRFSRAAAFPAIGVDLGAFIAIKSSSKA